MSEEKSFTVKLRGPYLAAIDKLVDEEKIYADPIELIREACRYLFMYYDIEPFAKSPPVRPPGKK